MLYFPHLCHDNCCQTISPLNQLAKSFITLAVSIQRLVLN